MTVLHKSLIVIIICLSILITFLNMDFLIDNFQSIKVIELLVSIIVALIIASLSIYGVRTWRVELKGKTKFQLAKEILTTAYKIRDRIQQVQNPFVSVNEFKDRESDKYETEHQKRIADSFFAFTNRFKSVQKELDKWYSLKLETEALLEKDKRKVLEKIDAIISRLYRAIKLYHEYKYHKNFDPKKHQKYENIIYGISPKDEIESSNLDNNDDGFQKDFDEAIKKIDNEFSKYI